jgi:hypothetical protein
MCGAIYPMSGAAHPTMIEVHPLDYKDPARKHVFGKDQVCQV